MLNVMDESMTDYIVTNNYKSDDKSTLTGSVYLTEGHSCYVIVEPFPETERDHFEGSFKVSVSRSEEKDMPAEVTLEEAAAVTVGTEEQASVLFRPAESGYYKFSSRITSKEDKSGSSDIMSVTSSDKKEINTYKGICSLEADREYYVWVSTFETQGKSADVEVRCRKVESMTAEEEGSFDITGDTIIQFKAVSSRPIAVYSVSDGNTEAEVFDSKGFPVSSDDDSGGPISGNDKDFALVMQVQEKNEYWIYAGGDFTECRIYITGYIGDGTSVGPDDIERTGTGEETDGQAGEAGFQGSEPVSEAEEQE